MTRDNYQWGLGSDTETLLSHEATELILYAQNDYGAHRAYVVPMLKACQKHYDKGRGDYERMVKGFARIACPIARQYTIEHGSMVDRWSDIFPPSVRKEFAEHMADYFLGEYRLGNRW